MKKPEELEGWQRTQLQRIYAGDYIPAPWFYDDRYDNYRYVHFACLSNRDPTEIWFIESDYRGKLNAWTPMGIGPYLGTYCPGEFSEKEIRRFARMIINAHVKLKISNDPMEMARVYRHGPISAGVPVAAKAVAWLEYQKYHIIAHAVVCPDKEVYSMVRGNKTAHKRLLRRFLAKEGYKPLSRSLLGACSQQPSAKGDNRSEARQPTPKRAKHGKHADRAGIPIKERRTKK